MPNHGARLGLGLIYQGLVSCFGLGVGLILVRVLAPNQYGFYTIVSAAIAACSVVSDGGAIFGLVSTAGRFWDDRVKVFEAVSWTFRSLGFTWTPSVLVFAIWLSFSLRRNSFDWLSITVGCLALALISAVGLRSKVWDALLRLNGSQKTIQGWQLNEVLLRFTLVIGLSLNGLLTPATAFAAVAICQAVLSLQLRRSCTTLVRYYPVARFESAIGKQVKVVVLRQMPNSIYFAIQGQLSVGLLALFSNVASVAQFGALSRFSAISGIVQSFAGLYLLTPIARAGKEWKNRFWKSALLVFGLAAVTPLAAMFFSDQMLAVLGPKYSGLNAELRLLTLSDGITSLLAICWAMLASRGHNKFSWSYIPLSVGIQAGGLKFVDISSLTGIISLTLASSLCLTAVITMEYLRAKKVDT